MLVLTLLIGAGAPMVDDDSSLDQFESDSPEVEAADYISENFTVEGTENTTTVQLIVQSENVLTQESLIESLEFQQQLRANDSINATLDGDDAMTGVENTVAITEIREQEADELEARGDELENESEALNDSADELEADFEALNESAEELENESEALNESADELEADFEALNDSADELEADFEALNESAEELEERGEELAAEERAIDRAARNLEEDREELEAEADALEADAAELEARTERLEAALEETVDLQIAYEAADTDPERDAIEDDIEAEWAAAVDEADLDAEQEATFRTAGEQVRETVGLETRLEGTITEGPGDISPEPSDDEQAILSDALAEISELQVAYEEADSDAERDAIEDEIETVTEAAIDDANLDRTQPDPTQADQFRGLVDEVRSLTSDLEDATPVEDAFELGTLGVFEDEFADLEEREQDLEERGESLEDRGERLADRGEQLADDAEALEEDQEALEDRGDELEERADELEERGEELEDRADELEAWGDELEERGDEIEERGEELEDRADELEERGDELEERGEALEDDWDDFQDADDPTLEEQIEVLESMDDDEFETAIVDALDDDDANATGALAFMPTGYEPGTTQADARMTFITQVTGGDAAPEMGEFDGDALDAQLDMRSVANAQEGGNAYTVFGVGIISDEIDRSMGDSLAIVGPLALIFVVVALFVAYRDLVDISLGVLGILLTLVWTFGFMGWTGISFNQMFVAIPVLLIGLAIDYAIHVFMRHREQREYDGVTNDIRGSMRIALAGVGVALLWVTATTAIGFLSNLISPIRPIQEFGVVSAFGIVSALLIFGALVPAAKIEIDTILEGRGLDRRRRAFGTGGGRFSDALSIGVVAARRAPLVVLLCVLLITSGGVYGATQVDTSFDEEDFLADSPPEWTQHLGPLAPGEYQAKDDLEFVNENFQREDSQANVLVTGNVTDPETLERIDEAESTANDSHIVYTLASGAGDVESPLTQMERVAAENESFNETYTEADTTGDDVPNENLTAVYDDLLAADDSAAEYVYRNDAGEYEAVQIVVGVQGDADFADVTDELRGVAAVIDDGGTDSRWTATATGDPVVNNVVEGDLMQTVLESLLITLVAVVVFLSVTYRLMGKGATLGIVTLLPVALAVSWILGSMYLLGMPFNVLTGMITSLTIGLGIAYSIHISSRYTLELERQGDVWDAMETTVTGTGGALLGSAATTVGGFGVLAFAILPVLQQFGIITGLTIIYAFLASVMVLPTLLVLWTRYFGPDTATDEAPTTGTPAAASDGGLDAGTIPEEDTGASTDQGDDEPKETPGSPGDTTGDDR